MLVWTLFFVTVTLALALIAMGRQVGNLRQDLRKLAEEFATLRTVQLDQCQDISGLSAAGLQLDRRYHEHETRLRELKETLESLRSENAMDQPYHAAIERARQGADAEALISEFGLSAAEADLLARLHGRSRPC